jgi:hypothetical protein
VTPYELTERIERLDREIDRQSVHVNALDLAGGSPDVTKAYLQILHRLRTDYFARLEKARSASALSEEQKDRQAGGSHQAERGH